MKLKTVRVEFEFVMAVDDSVDSVLEQHTEAYSLLGEVIPNLGRDDYEVFIMEFHVDEMPIGWNRECFPYGIPTVHTIGKILEENK